MPVFLFRLITTPTNHQQLGSFFRFTTRRRRSISSWASAIRKASSPHQALHFYTQMQHRSIPFDTHSILFTLKSCAHLHNPTLITHLHAHLFKLGFHTHVYVGTSLLHAYVLASFHDACHLFDEIPERNTVTWNTMLTGYCTHGNIESAWSLFQTMPVRSIVSWSAMISGYVNGGNWVRGVELFREMMINQGLKPDQVTLGTLLSACNRMGTLGLLAGKSIHGFIEKNGWNWNVELGTAVVDTYAKCGLWKYAFGIFGRMQERNVMTWSAMICGLAHHGCGHKALFMLERMKEQGIRPNEFTFTGILNACNHAGLVDEGVGYFHEMIEEYKLEPRIQHFGCMVDLLGKAGRLGEAYQLIESMKIEPNVIVWASLLSACKVHKQFEMAERVIERVLKVVKPENDGGVYTLISDLYASSGKWEEAQQMREMMVNQNVKKVRGSSFITSATL